MRAAQAILVKGTAVHGTVGALVVKCQAILLHVAENERRSSAFPGITPDARHTNTHVRELLRHPIAEVILAQAANQFHGSTQTCQGIGRVGPVSAERRSQGIVVEDETVDGELVASVRGMVAKLETNKSTVAVPMTVNMFMLPVEFAVRRLDLTKKDSVISGIAHLQSNCNYYMAC